MKSISALLLSLTLSLAGQEIIPTPEIKATREQSMEALMNAASPAELDQALKRGKQAGLPEQMLLEARFVFLVNENDLTALAALAPALEKQLLSFSPDNTLIFAVREDFESIVHYTKALGALQKEDLPLFKKHILEAFWLSPDHASQFAPHIKTLRMKKAMAGVTLDLARSFEDQKKKEKEKEKEITLATIKGDSPALLLHFWSPWVRPSILAMPEMSRLSKALIAQNIPVTSFLLSGNTESRKDADDWLAGEGKTGPGHWLIDSEKSSLASTLRISSFPTVVLVDAGGKILFNGDPADTDLWNRLSEINPEIEKPTENPVLPEESSGE